MNEMSKEALKELIDTAAGRNTADIVIKNCRIVDVLNGSIIEGDIAVIRGLIAGIGNYEGREEIDAKGKYAVPGFIDSHIHIESAYVSPEEIGRLLVPHGATTIIADPHEMYAESEAWITCCRPPKALPWISNICFPPASRPLPLNMQAPI